MSDLVKQRLQKLAALKKLKLDPYPQPNLENRDLGDTIASKLDKSVTVAGRLMLLRGHGKILFADLVDKTGKTQLFFEQNTLKSKMDLVKLLDLGDIISATGIVFKTQAGEVTIRVSEFQILAKNLRPLPEKFHGLTDIEERYRQRYVDLIVNPASREVFLTRSKILTELRHFFDEHGFLEVETPILQPIYGGASAKPFVTRHHELNQDMYLRIADELYLKRLIVGGLEKVYEVGKDFRNESVSRFHNPEFTQVEFYWAYVDYDVLMKFTEKLIIHIVKTVKKSSEVTFQGKTLKFTSPFPRLTFRDAILKHTKIDIDKIRSESDFQKVIKTKKLKLDLNGVVGLGAYFDALYKEYVRPKLIGPLFLTDYPAEMIALAKRKADNPQKIASFQLLACGTELLKAYNELNDPLDQKDRWLEEEALSKRGLDNAMQIDEDYLRALEYGMPPTAGWGMGLDRLTQFLTDSPTIKDVILFPSMKNEKPATKEIIIGQVLEIKDHPNAQHLKVVMVKVSELDSLQIVCGANNYQVGDYVPVALPGASVPTADGGTQIISKIVLRGVKSYGMLCSPLELGLSTDHTVIHILPKTGQKKLGQPVSTIR
jgi:lysyl-tRNA synthetase class 2